MAENEAKRYEELVSLKLDGRLDDENQKSLDDYMAHHKSPLLAAMIEADDLLWKWVQEPVPVPDNFHEKVMARIGEQPSLLAVAGAPTGGLVKVPQATRPLVGPIPGPLTMQLQEWQRRAFGMTRGLAIAAITLGSSVGLLMVLLMTGVLPAEGPLSGAVTTLRTYFAAAETWARSLFIGVDISVLASAGLVFGILALTGWQLVAQYQRTAREGRQTGYLEALS